jgi:hypothetical protein
MGAYLLPFDLVEVTGPWLEIRPLSTMHKLDRVFVQGRFGLDRGVQLMLRFPGRRYDHITTASEVSRIEATLARYRALAEDASARGDARALWEIDPLYEVRGSPAWAAAERGTPVSAAPDGAPLADVALPLGLRSPFLTTAVLCLTLSPIAWTARNRASDEAAFARLSAAPTTAGCAAYLARDGRHATAVRATLVPEARWRETSRSPGPLREFVRTYPGSRHVAEANAQLGRHYAASRESWLRRAPDDAALVAFMTRLLRWEEAHGGPSVRVRFAPPSVASLAAIDAFAAGRLYEGRRLAPIAPHLDDRTLPPQEARVATILGTALRTEFAPALLPLGRAERAADDAPPPPDAAAFDVRYAVVPTGSGYTLDGVSDRAFLGVRFAFTVTMRVPDGGAAYTFVTATRPSADFVVEHERGAPPDDARIYGAMIDSAFSHLGDHFRGVFFRDMRPRAPAATPPPEAAPAPPADEREPHRRRRRHRT